MRAVQARRYAADTAVPIERSKQQIELLLRQHGAEQFHTGWDARRDIIEFGWNGKQIRFVLHRPDPLKHRIDRRGRLRSGAQVTAAIDQAHRQRWRALYLVVRAKLESVEAGIAVFEEEFMAFIVVPGRNETVGEILLPRIAAGTFDIGRALPAAEVQ